LQLHIVFVQQNIVIQIAYILNNHGSISRSGIAISPIITVVTSWCKGIRTIE
jgi:hypothetical protein